MQPLISVVMAVYEPKPPLLQQALESVLNQSLGNFELIIVEDPSSSPGQQIVKQCDDARIRYLLNERRTSLVQQKNRGLDCVRGSYVAIMDADDISDLCRFEKQIAFLHKHPEVDVLGSQVTVINQNGASLGYRRFPLDHQRIVGAMKRVVPLCHPSVMLRREPLLRVGGYRETGYPIEDYELWSRLAKHQAHFANHPDALLKYRVHPDQTKAKRLRECIQGVLCVKKQFWRAEMDFPSRLRMWAEQLLLWLPPAIVYRVLLQTEYHQRRPLRWKVPMIVRPTTALGGQCLPAVPRGRPTLRS